MKNNGTNDPVKKFFTENKHEIPDNGFSNRVMQHLPQNNSSYEWILIPFTLAGFLISFLLCLEGNVFIRILEWIGNHPQDIMIALFVAPLLLLGLAMSSNRN